MDTDRPVAWIDYIIASDDPVDKELAQEFLARSWAHSQTMHWIMRETEKAGLTAEMMEKLDEQQALSDALQKTICRRGQALAAAGAAPADEAAATAWHAHRIRLAPTLPSDGGTTHRA